MDLFGRPSGDGIAAMQQNFQEPDDPGIVDFDAGIADRAYSDRQGDPLEERKVDVDVETLSLEAGEAIRNGLKSFADGSEVVESFLQTEVAQVVGTKFIAQVTGELFAYCFEKA